MRIQETIVFYLLLGGGVAGAMLPTAERRPFAERFFTTISASLFWPLYLPLLLSGPAPPQNWTGRPKRTDRRNGRRDCPSQHRVGRGAVEPRWLG